MADLRAVPKECGTCLRRGTRYAMVEPMFDGPGTVALRLHETERTRRYLANTHEAT